MIASACPAATYSLIISGLGGEPAYEQRFREQAQQLAEAARSLSGDESSITVLAGSEAGADAVRRELRALAQRAGPDDEVMVALIGHGSFDGESYRLNLPGPDLTASELETLFDQLRASRQLILNATSASGAALAGWKRDNRVVVTATKSGGERTATRFAGAWIDALTKPAADTDKDEIITAAEAFAYATRQVADSFKSDALLATEHAQIEGAIAEHFQVARLGTAARVSTDPALNALNAQRVRIERELDAVRERKTEPPTDAYYDELEGVLVKLALLQRQIDTVQAVQP